LNSEWRKYMINKLEVRANRDKNKGYTGLYMKMLFKNHVRDDV